MMIDFENARKTGIDLCINALGKDFCIANKDNALSGYEEPENGILKCFVTVDTQKDRTDKLSISGKPMQYQAFATVNMQTGEAAITKVIKPEWK